MSAPPVVTGVVRIGPISDGVPYAFYGEIVGAGKDVLDEERLNRLGRMGGPIDPGEVSTRGFRNEVSSTPHFTG